MNKTITILIGLLVISLGLYLTLFSKNTNQTSQDNSKQNKTEQKQIASTILTGKKATVYKTPTCGCCTGYIEFLKENGVEVKIVDSRDLSKFKQEFGVKPQQESCHTTVFENSYIVEGHVPLATLEKLFTENPDIKGVALPNMPLGTPGMPGPKTEIFKTEILGKIGEIYNEV